MAISLASISRDTALRAPRIVLIGKSKVGKSEFFAAAPNPIFIPVKGEEGIDSLPVHRFPVCTSYAELMEMLGSLYSEDHDYQTLCIDSASTLEPILLDEAMAREGVKSQGSLGGGFGHQDDTLLKLWREITDGLDAIRNAKNMTVGIVGHVTVTEFKDPQAEPYNVYEMDLRKKSRELLYRWADSTLFANFRPAIVTKDDVGFKKQYRRALPGTDERVLHTQKRATHPGGGRGIYGWLPYELPLDWRAYADAVAAVAAQSGQQPAEPEVPNGAAEPAAANP